MSIKDTGCSPVVGENYNNIMRYKIRRFSTTEVYQSEEIRENTINGRTSGEVILSHGKKKTGRKPVERKIKLKYHD